MTGPDQSLDRAARSGVRGLAVAVNVEDQWPRLGGLVRNEMQAGHRDAGFSPEAQLADAITFAAHLPRFAELGPVDRRRQVDQLPHPLHERFGRTAWLLRPSSRLLAGPLGVEVERG